MKSNICTFLIFFASVFAFSSCTNDVWSELPTPVANFFTNYFPSQEVISYSEGENSSVATIRGGATVTFNSAGSWIDVNGNGSTLPDIFLYDQLPQPLYRYLQEMESVDGVYRAERNDVRYRIKLLDNYVEYSISDGAIKVV